MPQRQSVRRLTTAETQGDDSYVVVSGMTYGESLERDKLIKAGKLDADEFLRQSLARHVLDWNWVGDDGQPLPKPKDNPGVFKALTDGELDVLTSAIVSRPEAERKNSVPASEAPSGPAEATSPASGPS
jgi:hypothetical protein